ncbi:50S ribosomal protein L18 [Candidatus Schneideria nysicola]|uniref:50S ribosomal protein L18 n=1 Tax=Candidatus Schneideria nysicola TaxID=1081631 RepID=UPI001CAA6321|nr:50S ribosomal protein L18 [Candidatus Schneideria nysicola]UAJ64934.1 50S ribosomal protein L18 [Candidatus Schneideria nysicola]
MNKKFLRLRRASRARAKLRQLNAIRLVVYRTSRHIYSQIITLSNNKIQVLVSASTLEKAIKEKLNYTGNKEAADLVGKMVAIRAIQKNITNISFDRSGFKYHGRVKVLADSARKHGLFF